ncbi:hypothetical protein ABW636_08890 [Aquimarina sp. 2201CG1-2-11]|uniref:hypothetical protein n=1 Tax=Aquimarina discodermiae TaxID=3231043 RepID=UPI0034617DA8
MKTLIKINGVKEISKQAQLTIQGGSECEWKIVSISAFRVCRRNTCTGERVCSPRH